MRKAIATVCLSGTLADKLTAAAAARFDGIEIFDNDLVASDLSPEEVALRCADLGLAIELFQPLRDIEGWAPERFDAVLRRLRHKFAIMGRLGVDLALACSNVQPDAVDDLDFTAEQLHAVGDLAAEHGITIAFEALAWGRHIGRVRDSWEAVRRADHPHIALAVDTFHVLSRGDDASALEGIPGSAIAYLQIADAPRLDMNVLQWSRHHRCFPGQGDLDVAGLVGAVVDAGYRGPLSLEVFSDVVRVADPRMNALDGMRSLLHLEEQLRARRGSAAAQVDLFDPPPVPTRAAGGFVEFAVEEPDFADTDPNTSVTAMLEALGFKHVSTHARGVQWWRNGEAHVCVTTLPVPGRHRDRPFVSAVALLVDDVRDVSTRAGALLWPTVAYRRGRFTSALPGIDTPSGVHVFLSAPAGEEQDWRSGYPGTPEELAHGDWLGIDHIGATVPAETYPAEQSFYRSVLGLTGGELSEFIDPGGRVTSRPFRPAQGDLRVVLNVADTRERASGLRQVAFACPDVAAAVRRGRAAGLAFLDVPDNYYDDLQSRVDLDADTLAHLREHSLMYDEDEFGTLLHAYTRDRAGFYVELVERRGGYDGYGAPGTHVRLAAQSR
ncbi:MAG: TIM barrel protein [Mobilicoccus sp.]|nr:TIM barrel protein [Mobilicoccus sp.]